jgi:hypothetical protein
VIRCFWSTARGWGVYQVEQRGAAVHVLHGGLECEELVTRLAPVRGVWVDGVAVRYSLEPRGGQTAVRFEKRIVLVEGSRLEARL